MADNSGKYEILRKLALAGARGDQADESAQAALEATGKLVGLSACSMNLWDSEMKVTLSLAWSDDEESGQQLARMEEQLFGQLRREQKMLAAYMTFDTEPPRKAFSLPLRHGHDCFGAVVGIQEGTGSLVGEDIFLEALAASLTLKAVADGLAGGSGVGAEALARQRQQAINETAVAVNHEINNPLTAILGNVQLMLMKPEALDQDVKDKLTTIEQAAMKIRDVNKKLLSARNSKSIEYGNGTNMIDLRSDDDSE